MLKNKQNSSVGTEIRIVAASGGAGFGWKGIGRALPGDKNTVSCSDDGTGMRTVVKTHPGTGLCALSRVLIIFH